MTTNGRPITPTARNILGGPLVVCGTDPHQREQARRFGVEVVEMRDWRPGMDLGLRGPLYLSLDLDALDPAFAPGISHHEPGGFTTREVLGIIQSLPVPLIGADLVEFNVATIISVPEESYADNAP